MDKFSFVSPPSIPVDSETWETVSSCVLQCRTIEIHYGQAPNGGLENVYREIRSFGQALIAITQHPSMLPVYVLGNTHTLIFMALTHEADIIAARQALFLERTQDVFLDRLKIGEGIVKIKGRLPPTHVRFKEVNVKPGSVKDEDLKR